MHLRAQKMGKLQYSQTAARSRVQRVPRSPVAWERSSQVHLALTQPDACGAGESLGDVEIGSSGEGSPNLQNSKSHSSESNRKHLFAYTSEAIW